MELVSHTNIYIVHSLSKSTNLLHAFFQIELGTHGSMVPCNSYTTLHQLHNSTTLHTLLRYPKISLDFQGFPRIDQS